MPDMEFQPLPSRPNEDERTSRMRARAEEKRANRHDAVQIRIEKDEARRAAKLAAREDRRRRRAQTLADRSAHYRRLRALAAAVSQRLLVVVPITAPMAVAWTGQIQFAMRVLFWVLPGAVIYAAAYELTTAFCAWMYHQARQDGDLGWEYRIATWLFAIGAALQQWWHYSNHWHATPRSVTFSFMSGVGVGLWELYARLIHRRKLRADGKLPPARPRIGLARWLRYPGRSWTTRSLIILRDYETLAEAWTAADETIRQRQETKAKRDQSRRSTETTRKTETRHPGTGTETAPTGSVTRRETKRDRPRETAPATATETETPQVTPETTARETTETTAVAIGDRETEIRALVSLMEERGDAMAVSLNDAIETTGCPKSTAAKRLAAARDRYRRKTA